MKRFTLSGKMIFDAKNIDDALSKLSKHFKDIGNGKDGLGMYGGTNIKLEGKKLKIKKGKNENIK